MEPIIKIRHISKDDPLKEKKINIINGINRVGDLMDSLKRDEENLLLSMGTFFFGVFISSFFRSLYSYLTFGIVVLIFLIFATRKNQQHFNSLFDTHEQLVEEGRMINLNLKQKIK